MLSCKAARTSEQSLCCPKVGMRMSLPQAASVVEASKELGRVSKHGVQHSQERRAAGPWWSASP